MLDYFSRWLKQASISADFDDGHEYSQGFFGGDNKSDDYNDDEQDDNIDLEKR